MSVADDKEILFFVSKSLTISTDKRNRLELMKILKNSKIDWDKFVKVSTYYNVLPAIYFNYKRFKFLNYLPENLVSFMKEIAEINRNRNSKIIKQAFRINDLLIKNNVNALFLRGAGNLVEGLYKDNAERMVGDIDFLVSKNDYLKTIKILNSDGYEKVSKSNLIFPHFRHYPRLVKDGEIAAIEIHKELVIEKYANEFNYDTIKNNTQNINGFNVLSYDHQLVLSIISSHINDSGYYFKFLDLKTAFDVLLLSKKISPFFSLDEFGKLKNKLNVFIAMFDYLLANTNSLSYEKNKETTRYLELFKYLLSNKKIRLLYNKLTRIKLSIRKKLKILNYSIFYKEYRIWLFYRIFYNKNNNQDV